MGHLSAEGPAAGALGQRRDGHRATHSPAQPRYTVACSCDVLDHGVNGTLPERSIKLCVNFNIADLSVHKR